MSENAASSSSFDVNVRRRLLARSNQYASTSRGAENSGKKEKRRTQKPVDDDVSHRRRAAKPTTTRAASSSPENKGKEKNGSVPIPLSLWESSKGSNFKRQYACDGNRLRLLTSEEAHDLLEEKKKASSSGSSNQQQVTKKQTNFDPLRLARNKRAFMRQMDAIRDSLFPSSASVTSDYWDYAKYRFSQRVASSTMTVLATQQMLAAIGLGATKSIPAAAALNWVLKDGLGRLGKLSVATNFGRSFDSDVKRLRFSSSLVYTSAVFIETITPFFPKHFLTIATLANVGKSIGITAGNVVRPPIQKTFALEENLGEIAAKTSAQQVLADNLGLAIGVSIMKLQTKFVPLNLQRSVPLVLFPVLASIDLVSIHKQLKSVQLRMLNKERAEIVAEYFVQEKTLLNQMQVAEKERLLFPTRLDESTLPLRVTSLRSTCPTLESLAAAFKHDVNRPYVLKYEPYNRRKWNPWSALFFQEKKPMKYKGRALLALSHRATSKDILRGILQVAHIRNLPFRKDLNENEAYEWAVTESERRAKADVNKFHSRILSNGWQTNVILLSSDERMPYFVDSELRSTLKTAINAT